MNFKQYLGIGMAVVGSVFFLIGIYNFQTMGYVAKSTDEVILILLTRYDLLIGGIIMLLGSQVMAMDRRDKERVAWHQSKDYQKIKQYLTPIPTLSQKIKSKILIKKEVK